MQPINKVRNHPTAEWPRTVECNRWDEISKPLGSQIFNKVRHSRRLHLEYCACITVAEHFRCAFIDKWNFIYIKYNPTGLTDMFYRTFDNAKCTKTEKIHFKKTKCLNVILVKLRDKCSVRYPDRYMIGERFFCNDDTCSVNRCVARQSLNLARKIDHTAHCFICVINTTEISRLL